MSDKPRGPWTVGVPMLNRRNDMDDSIRGECCIMLRGEACGKPSVYSEPCRCDKCDSDAGYHLPWHLCAGHYDEMMASQRAAA